MRKLLYLSFIIITGWSCIQSNETEKYQSNRDNIVNVQEKVKWVEMEDVFISSINRLYLADDYLIISDSQSTDETMYLFDKDNFRYVTGIAHRGKGPGEIANIGHIAFDKARHKFYVSDNGKRCIFSYDLDSVVSDPKYMPSVKISMSVKIFPDKYQFFHDTLCIGRVIEPIGNSNFKQSVAKWSMALGEFKTMNYTHPDIEKKRVYVNASIEHGIYVEYYQHHDLMTICSLDGELKYNVYGPNWDSRNTNKTVHYGTIVFCGDKIFASYAGKDNFSKDNDPTKIIVFDMNNGDYLYTLEVGYSIVNFCYDKDNHRLILFLNEEMQFAYLDLNGLIE
jgi:outer membrane protein assembly factor BamB